MDAKEARKIIEESKYYSMDDILFNIKIAAKSGSSYLIGTSNIHPTSIYNLKERGFKVVKYWIGLTKISW